MEITPNSWHHRLATEYSYAKDWDIQKGRYNFCKYFWAAFWGFIMTLVVVAIGVFIGLGWIQGIGAGLHMIFSDAPFLWFFDESLENWRALPGVLGVVSMALHAVVLIIVMWAISADFVSTWWGNRKRDPETGLKQEPRPSFFGTAYSAWKNKWCPIITLKEEDESDPLEPKWPRGDK